VARLKIYPQLQIVFLFSLLCETPLTRAQQKPPTNPIQVTVRSVDQASSFDWNGLTGVSDAHLFLNTQEGLFQFDPKSEKIKPAIAKSVQRSADGRQLTIQLNQKFKWSDGKPITAYDFAFGWFRSISPEVNSIYAYYFYDIVNAEDYSVGKISTQESVGIKALDDERLQITLKNPDPSWEIRTAFWPFFASRKDLVEKNGPQWSRAGVVPSTGPFILQSYEPNSRMVLKKNANYHGPKPQIDIIEFLYSLPFKESLDQYTDQKIQILFNLPPEQLMTFKKRKDYRQVPIQRVMNLILNTQKFPTNNLQFRKALFAALDPTQLVPRDLTVLKSHGNLIAAPLLGSKTTWTHQFNLKQAQIHLKKSGVLVNSKLKIQLASGTRDPFVEAAKRLQDQWSKNLGLTVEALAENGNEYNTRLDLGEYSATLTTWTSKLNTAQDFLLPYSSEAKQNRSHFVNSDYLDAIRKSSAATSDRLRVQSLDQAQKIIIQDHAVLYPIATETIPALVQSSLQGVYFNHFGVPLFHGARLESHRATN
jgi:oligopeptide transport system substrate-binding protein